MKLLDATLLDFRNLAEVQLSFSEGVNVLVGSNGQGKTNVLEALNYLALGRSFRGARDEDLIRFDTDVCHVRLRMADEKNIEHELEFGFDRSGTRRVRVDGELVKRKIDLVGQLVTVVFDPQTVELVRGGPEGRRRWIDQGISSVDSSYLTHLQAFSRALKQKSSLLRDIRKRIIPVSQVREDLVAWNVEMARCAAPIVLRRAEWLSECSPAAGEAHADLAASAGTLETLYRPQLDMPTKTLSKTNFAEDILGVFDYIMENEIQRGRCLAGPQMDDVDIALDGVNLRTFGSRGETRTAAVALKLAQAEMVYRNRNIRPVLFFDDIFSELDKDRSRELQQRTATNHQVFIATARTEDVAGWEPPGRCTWLVEQGSLTATS